MRIIDGLLSRLGYIKFDEVAKSVGPLIDDHRIWRSLSDIFASKSAVTQPYKQSIWIYSCISTIVENICRIPFVLKKDAGELEPSIIESGPIYDLFQNPNPYMTQRTLLEATLTYYCLRGECFWIKEGQSNVTEIPKMIWCFDPVRFYPVTNERTGLLMGWEYRGKEKIYFSNDEILFFKMFNPYDDIRGLSPAVAATLSIDQEYYASTYNNSFFKNGATVGGFISVPAGVELTDEQWNRLLKQFEDRHQGASKAHKIAVMEGGGTFTEAKLTQKDMDFIEGKNLTRTEILAAYRVNEVILGIFSGIRSYEGIKAAHKAFWEECLMPKITYFQDELWTKFFAKLGNRRGKGRIWAEWDTANVGPLQINYEDKIVTAAKMFNMGWPINDINKRLQLGMKEVPWGDEWWVPGGYMPVTALEKASKDPDKESSEEKVETPSTETYCFDYRLEFESKLKRFVFEQRKKALAESSNGKKWDRIVHEKDYDKLKLSLVDLYSQIVRSGVVHIQESSGELIPLDGYSIDIISFVEARASFVIKGFKGVAKDLIEALSSGSISDIDLGSKLRGVYNFLTSRSSDIAKSEVEKAFKFGCDLGFAYVKEILKPSLEWKG